jgi:hypothetical protein
LDIHRKKLRHRGWEEILVKALMVSLSKHSFVCEEYSKEQGHQRVDDAPVYFIRDRFAMYR